MSRESTARAFRNPSSKRRHGLLFSQAGHPVGDYIPDPPDMDELTAVARLILRKKMFGRKQ